MSMDLEHFDRELKSFLEFCRENRLSDQEIAKICTPLISPIKSMYLKRNFLYVAIILPVLLTVYFLTYFETFTWHLSAIGRIILLEIIPLWDWKHMKNEKCLIYNFIESKSNTGSNFNCALCESIDKIYVETQINSVALNEHYIELHRPVVILDALQNWPIYTNSSLDIISDEIIRKSTPCKLSTNIYNEATSIGKLLKKIKNFNDFFLHFQNCDFDAVKAFRLISPRPSFLPVELSPIQYNWLLVSKYYNVTNLKKIELNEPIAFIGQVEGSNLFRVFPRSNCETECPILDIVLTKGEALVITAMWDLEYLPHSSSKNVAIILEMH